MYTPLPQHIRQTRPAVDCLKFLRSTRHKISHFGNILSSQSLGEVLKKKLKLTKQKQTTQEQTRMWAKAQRDDRPAEYRWRPLFNAAKFG